MLTGDSGITSTAGVYFFRSFLGKRETKAGKERAGVGRW